MTTMQIENNITDETSNQGANLEDVSIALPLKSFTVEPDAGFRLSRHVAKADKNGKIVGLPASVGIIVPNSLNVSEAAKFEGLNDYLVDCLYELQDKIIRVDLNKGETQIRHESINYANMEKFASTLAGVGKLSAEKIEAWFTAECADAVAVMFLEQVGKNVEELSSEQMLQMTQRQNAVKAFLVGLSAAKNSFANESVRTKLRSYVELTGESQIRTRLLGRIETAEIISSDML